MFIETAIRLSKAAKKNPTLMPDHKPDVPDFLIKEIADLKMISFVYMETNDTEELKKVREEIKETAKALSIYTSSNGELKDNRNKINNLFVAELQRMVTFRKK